MSHYKSNLRDIEFNLFEVLKTQDYLGKAAFEELDAETAQSILVEVERLCREDLAASYVDGDRNPPVFDPATNTAPVPESFQKSYQAWMDSEWWRLQTPEEIGGQASPATLIWAMAEFILGANAPIWMYAAGPSFAGVIYPQRQRREARRAHRRDHGRAPVGRHHGAHRARRGLRRRRRPRQGHPATRTAPGTSRASSASSPRPSTA